MSYDLDVLRALVRVARRRIHPDTAALVARAGGSPSDVRDALARLVRDGLVLRTPARVAPTLAGLAVAVASAKARRAALARPSAAPMTRRHAA